MFKYNLINLVLVFALSFCSNSYAAEFVHVVTEDWKPFSYVEDGEVKGTATTVVREVLAAAGIDYDIKVYPWPRAYKMALNEENTLIFAIVRTDERESLFKWVGQITPTDRASFYKAAVRDDIEVSTLEDAKQLVVGTNRDSVEHQFLQENEFRNVLLSQDQVLSLKQLLHDRIDLWIMHDINVDAYLKQAGVGKDEIAIAFTAFEGRAYMAFSKLTSDEVVEKVKRAYKSLKGDGLIANYD